MDSKQSDSDERTFTIAGPSRTFSKLLLSEGSRLSDGGIHEKTSSSNARTRTLSNDHEEACARDRHHKLRYGSDVLAFSEDGNSWLRLVLTSPKFETFGGFVVLCNFLVMTIETNARSNLDDGATLRMTEILNRAFLVYYIGECIARLCILGKMFFLAGWNILDLVIVCTGLLGEMLTLTSGEQSSEGLESVAMLKSMRMLRLIRLLRLLVAFRELYVLVAGLSRCMKTLLWSCGLIFLALNVWSIISVEYLQPLVRDLTSEGVYDRCERCQVAFSNIWRSNATWFAVVSGDGWTALFWPLIERYYWPFFLLAANIFIICYGLMNLIVAAIVESSAQAREDDIKSAAKMYKLHQNSTLSTFQDLCKAIDTDNDGGISVDEFIHELRQNRELQNMLLVMGVEEREIQGLFEIMDTNGNGTLETDEFVEQFYEMRTHVVKTSVYYVLRYCQSLLRMQQKQWDFLQELKDTQLQPSCNANAAAANVPVPQEVLRYSASNALEQQMAKQDLSSPSRASRAVCESSDFTQPEAARPGWYYFGCSPPIGGAKLVSDGGAKPASDGDNLSGKVITPSLSDVPRCPQFLSDGNGKMEVIEALGMRNEQFCSNEYAGESCFPHDKTYDEFTELPLDTSTFEKLPILIKVGSAQVFAHTSCATHQDMLNAGLR